MNKYISINNLLSKNLNKIQKDFSIKNGYKISML